MLDWLIHDEANISRHPLYTVRKISLFTSLMVFKQQTHCLLHRSPLVKPLGSPRELGVWAEWLIWDVDQENKQYHVQIRPGRWYTPAQGHRMLTGSIAGDNLLVWQQMGQASERQPSQERYQTFALVHQVTIPKAITDLCRKLRRGLMLQWSNHWYHSGWLYNQ